MESGRQLTRDTLGAMKPSVSFLLLSIASVVTAIFLQYLLLGIFEERVGTPIIQNAGEEPFAYDTDVMPQGPCCGSLLYLVIAAWLYPVLLASVPAYSRRWWTIAGAILALPFLIPLLLVVAAIFGPGPEPWILNP